MRSLIENKQFSNIIILLMENICRQYYNYNCIYLYTKLTLQSYWVISCTCTCKNNIGSWIVIHVHVCIPIIQLLQIQYTVYSGLEDHHIFYVNHVQTCWLSLYNAMFTATCMLMYEFLSCPNIWSRTHTTHYTCDCG